MTEASAAMFRSDAALPAETACEPIIIGGAIPDEARQDPTDELVYRLSHDLRASVRALTELPVWFAEDLENAGIALPGDTARTLDLMGRHARRLDLLISGLLEYSRVGRLQTHEYCSVERVLEEVLEGLPEARTLSIRVRLPQIRVPIGITDLRRVFAIPIVNAARHGHGASRITVIGRVGTHRWHLYIRDNGPGIAEADRESVFKPLVKLVSRDVDNGAGMGLAVLRRITRHYGGQAEFLAPGRRGGTLLHVALPLFRTEG
ncbi:sensor histidine kinase [Roseivivax sp. CAU 1761]